MTLDGLELARRCTGMVGLGGAQPASFADAAEVVGWFGALGSWAPAGARGHLAAVLVSQSAYLISPRVAPSAGTRSRSLISAPK